MVVSSIMPALVSPSPLVPVFVPSQAQSDKPDYRVHGSLSAVHILSDFVKGFRMPANHLREGCTEAGVRKASKEETAGEFAPTLVSIYGEFAGAAWSDVSVPDRTTVE